MEEKENNKVHAPHSFYNILPEQHVQAFKKAACEFGVKVSILGLAGDKYTETRLDQNGNEYKYKATVPEGNLRVQITHQLPTLNPFYDKALQILIRMQTQKK